MRGIVKDFPGVVANDHVDLEVQAGEIHALLGENGAGKSTLMKILAGFYTPDAGEILIHGRPVKIAAPKDAIREHIGMVYQHFMLVEPMTVAENFLLGLDGARFIPDLHAIRRQIERLSERYQLGVHPDAYVWQLSVGEQQRVEILRLLHRGADILILDEPTAVLTPQEANQLAAALRQMASQGKAVILITHKLDEVMAFSDRVTVLRAGRNVATLVTRQTTPVELTRLMLGREMGAAGRVRRPVGDAVPLQVEKLQARGDRGLPAVKGVSFSIRQGEILGVAGVAGNGQRELTEVIAGLRPAVAGSVFVRGADVTNQPPKAMIARGVSYIPEDRLSVGSVGGLSVSDNLILKRYRRAPLSRGPLLRFRAIRDFVLRLIAQFGVMAASAEAAVGSLSGGNVQKVILAREISADPDVILAVHPTRGLDVGAAETVRRLLLEQQARGAAILLISEDLDELMDLCNRIAVMHEGEMVGVLDASQTDVDRLGLMMAGALRL